MLTALFGVRRGSTCEPDYRGPVIGGIIIGIVVGLAVLREQLWPQMPVWNGGLDLLDPSIPPYVRPLGLFISLVVELTALVVLARVLDRRGWRPVWHVVATVSLSVVMGTLCMLGIKTALYLDAPIQRAVLSGPIGGIQIYALWVLAFRYPKIVDAARAREREAERLRRTAELARLRAHLQPHFLRNTLNAIAASVRDDPDEARDLLAALGDLLSDSLERDDDPTQTLGEETAWLRRYSEIFEARHRGTLRFSWDLDPAASTTRLPRLLLQPLVENAVRHGALARIEGGEVSVQTRRIDDGVVVVVRDDGPGIDARRPEGLGLHLVRRRLAIECPDGNLRIESSAQGTTAIVEIR